MGTQLQYSMALEVARERIRDAEVRARLRWGEGQEASLERGMIGRLAGLGRSISRTPSRRDERGGLLETAATQHRGGGVPA